MLGSWGYLGIFIAVFVGNLGVPVPEETVMLAAGFLAGRVLLDPNELSEDGTVAVSGASVSDDGRLLAYSTSSGGSDWQTWRVRDVATGTDTGDLIEWSKFSGAAWRKDASGFYYGAPERPAAGSEYLRHRGDAWLATLRDLIYLSDISTRYIEASRLVRSHQSETAPQRRRAQLHGPRCVRGLQCPEG